MTRKLLTGLAALALVLMDQDFSASAAVTQVDLTTTYYTSLPANTASVSGYWDCWLTATTGCNQAVEIYTGGAINASGNPLYIDTASSGNLYTAVTSPIPAGTNAIGSVELLDASGVNKATISASGTVQTTVDPCSYSKKSTAFFNITASGASIITAVSSDYVYICSINVSTTTITNFSLVAGTGSSVCTGGSPYPIWGNPAETAANGFQIGTATTAPGGGGVVVGNGAATVAGGSVGGTVNYNICALITTTNSPTVNGTVTYVQTAS